MTLKLGKRTRKGLLAAHIVTSGAWIGMEMVMGVLVFTALSDPSLAVACYRALGQFAVWPVLIMGVLCLASGVLLGLGTKYGLVKYWWVATKLGLNVILCVLVFFALRPGVDAAASGQAAGDLVFPPIVSAASLLFAVLLSVYKPWGRVRQRTYPQSRPAGDAPKRAMAES
jgi:hypothetical protein